MSNLIPNNVLQQQANNYKRMQNSKVYPSSGISNAESLKKTSYNLYGKNQNKNSNAVAKQKLQKKVGSAALQTIGVPKGVSDKAIDFAQTEKGQKVVKAMTKNLPGGKIMNSLLNFSNKKQNTEKYEEGYANFNVSLKKVFTVLAICVPVFAVVVFCCLVMSSSQVLFNSFSLGFADSLGNSDNEKIEDMINTKAEEKLSEEISDDEAIDAYIMDSDSIIRSSKLYSYDNIVQVANESTYLTRKYNEASLDKLEDFYPGIKDTSKNYDENMVYDFYFKMYKLYISYRDDYGVHLDLPLLMATLNLQSSDKNVIFESNLGDEDRAKTERKLPIEEFDYYYVWEDYITTKSSGQYDMEILAQNMVSVSKKNGCKTKDGQCYELNHKKYKEFLKEFLEKKYYEEGEPIDSNNNEDMLSTDNDSSEGTTDEGTTDGNTNLPTTNNSVCKGATEFVKYDLTEDQLAQLASVCYYEQGTPKGAAAEASLMANLFEIRGSSYGVGAQGLYNYVRQSGWFYNAANHMDNRAASSAIIEAVRSVLVEGKRTVPGYIDEHDCISCTSNGDVSSVTNDGVSVNKNDRSNYIQFKSVIKNVYGSTYTFYSFPTETSDPFGYTSETRRQNIGDFYYDYDTGKPVGCTEEISDDGASNESSGESSIDTPTKEESSMASAMVSLANKEYLNRTSGGSKYINAFGAPSSTPWCVIFVWYISANTNYNGKSLYPDIISYKSASTGEYMQYFNTSKDENINFYYNDSCSKLKGKNGSGTYTPKPGDYIFFDWGKTFTQVGDGQQDHTGMVEKYENGKIYTIEGNISNGLYKRVIDINSCEVIGFGSWY